MAFKETLNLTDQRNRNMVCAAIRALPDGEYRIEIVQKRRRRTDRQNRYYWPCFCQRFAEWLSERQGRTVQSDAAHNIFKETFLRVPEVTEHGEVIELPNGDPLMRTRSTTELTVDEFNQYLDDCAGLLRELCEIEVPQPNEYREIAA